MLRDSLGFKSELQTQQKRLGDGRGRMKKCGDGIRYMIGILGLLPPYCMTKMDDVYKESFDTKILYPEAGDCI